MDPQEASELPLQLFQTGGSLNREDWVPVEPSTLLNELDHVVFDQDGVVYTGETQIGRSSEVVASLRAAGKGVTFVTNSPAPVHSKVSKLLRMGITCDPAAIVTAATATAAYLKREGLIGGGQRTYVVGQPGLHEVLREAGAETLGLEDAGLSFESIRGFDATKLDPLVTSVVVAFDSRICYGKIHKAMLYIRRRNCRFVGTNPDASSPVLDSGELAPGGGTFVAAVACASAQTPTICGKPSEVLGKILVAERGLDPKRTLMVGDRIDTDVAFGRNAGFRTLLVLSGATADVEEVLATARTSPRLLPDFVGADVSVLLPRGGS